MTARSSSLSTQDGIGYSPEQKDRLLKVHARVTEARRELDALIGDAYLRPRASIVPVHFLDLASAVEKLRWAEKEWREVNDQVDTTATAGDATDDLVEVVPDAPRPEPAPMEAAGGLLDDRR